MRIVRHRLRRDDGSEVPFPRSPNQSSGITPLDAVMHFTAGASAESSIAWLRALVQGVVAGEMDLEGWLHGHYVRRIA